MIVGRMLPFLLPNQQWKSKNSRALLTLFGYYYNHISLKVTDNSGQCYSHHHLSFNVLCRGKPGSAGTPSFIYSGRKPFWISGKSFYGRDALPVNSVQALKETQSNLPPTFGLVLSFLHPAPDSQGMEHWSFYVSCLMPVLADYSEGPLFRSLQSKLGLGLVGLGLGLVGFGLGLGLVGLGLVGLWFRLSE